MAMKLPYTDVEFDKKGALVDPAERDTLDHLLAEQHPTDVVVLSHGWNNSHAEARALYERLVDSFVDVRPQVAGADKRQFVIVGALWPSIQWAPADEAAGAGAGVVDEQWALEAEIAERIESPSARAKLLALVPHLEDSSEAQEQFLELLRSTLPKTSAGEDDAAFEALKTASAQEVIDAARTSG